MSKQYPRCQICGEEIAEGSIYKRHKPLKPMYVCYDCFMLLAAVIADSLPAILRELANKAEKPLEKRFEVWEYKETEKEAEGK